MRDHVQQTISGIVVGLVVGLVAALGTSYVQSQILDQRLGAVERRVESLALDSRDLIRVMERMGSIERRLAEIERRSEARP